MKSCLAAIALAAAAAAAAVPAQPCTEVDVDNVRPQQGALMVAAYGSAEAFGRTPLVALRVPAGTARMTVQLCGLSGSEVALTLFQDLDGDGQLGRNLLGVPTEPWGASGTPGALGPTWDNARVPLDGHPIAVRLTP